MAQRPIPGFGLNRLDLRSPEAFAAHARRIESLGWDCAFVPSSPLLVRDPYVLLAFAARATERIRLGPLIEVPAVRDPAAIASSIATVDELAGGRALLALGAGDTAVRLSGKRPLRVTELETAAALARRLLAGEAVETGARRPSRLRHARPVPVWIASGGPRTLRMAGRVADGVFLRVGRHPANLRAAVDAVRAGAREAGRDPDAVRLGVVIHTIVTEDAKLAAALGRAIAAGFYEYTPALFDAPRLGWDGPPVAELRRDVWPDFHHAADLRAAGERVSFLPDAAVDAFALCGGTGDVRAQLGDVLELGLPFELVVPHPVPLARGQAAPPDYAERFAREVIQPLRSA